MLLFLFLDIRRRKEADINFSGFGRKRTEDSSVNLLGFVRCGISEKQPVPPVLSEVQSVVVALKTKELKNIVLLRLARNASFRKLYTSAQDREFGCLSGSRCSAAVVNETMQRFSTFFCFFFHVKKPQIGARDNISSI